MSIYTYKSNKSLCDFLGTEYFEHPSVSDQEFAKIPEDALTNPHKVYSRLGTEAAKIVNTGRKRPEHSALMKQRGIKPPLGAHKGFKHSEESRKLIGERSGKGRLGKKRGPYKIKSITCDKCGTVLSSSSLIGVHKKRCDEYNRQH